VDPLVALRSRAFAVPRSDESALVVLVPEAELLVAPFRRQFDRSAIRGMPAHITVLYPFRLPRELSEMMVQQLRSSFSRIPRFAFRLTGIFGFPGAVYLAPDPMELFDALAREVAAWFPESPRYGGAFADPMPHLTVAREPPAVSLAAVSTQQGNGADVPRA
jgi:2'-5' RNA ligase